MRFDLLASRAPFLLAVVLALAGLGGACGGDDGTPEDGAPAGDTAPGRAIFVEEAEPPCGSCHVLEDAGTTGTVGPSLDEVQPDAERVAQAVRTGPGAMPSYEGLSDEQIQDVAVYVAEASGGG